jgi:putative PIN family toxin of toxin-antitoxin system
MRVILDSNIWISALLFGGLPRQVLTLANTGKIQIYSSEVLLDELEEVLSYQKLQKRITRLGTTSDELLTTVRQLIQVCTIAEIEPVPELRDQDDLIVLATAVAAQAIAIVSGDNDLLVLQSYSGILIMNVADFLARYFPTE